MIVIRDSKTFYLDFDWPEDIHEKLKHEIEFIIKINELNNYCPNISMATIFMNTENSKTNELHKLVLNLSQKLDIRSSNKHVALENLSIYYTWKNTCKQHNKQ